MASRRTRQHQKLFLGRGNHTAVVCWCIVKRMAAPRTIDPKGEANGTVLVACRVTKAQADRLRIVAATQDRNMSEVLREAIEQATA